MGDARLSSLTLPVLWDCPQSGDGCMFLVTMTKGEDYTQELAYDDERNVRIKSTCKRCGESRLTNIRDCSLWEWEENHVCGHVPQNLIQFPARA